MSSYLHMRHGGARSISVTFLDLFCSISFILKKSGGPSFCYCCVNEWIIDVCRSLPVCFCLGHTVALWLHQGVHGKISGDLAGGGGAVTGWVSSWPGDSTTFLPHIETSTEFHSIPLKTPHIKNLLNRKTVFHSWDWIQRMVETVAT